VQVVRTDGGMFAASTVKAEPNPVIAELRPAGPPPRANKPMRPKRKKPSAAAAPAGGSPFPDPGQPAPQR